MSKLISICWGHHYKTAGKRTPKFEDGTQIREWEFNYPTSKKLGELLEYNGFNILYVSSSEEDTPLKTRTDLANKNNADLYISIHYNALAETWRNGVGGIETYHHTNSYKSKTIAETVHKHLINDTDMKDRGVKSANFHVLRETKMPSILVELGFMDIRAESLLMLDEDYQWKCAKAIAKGVCEYYGVEYKEPKPTLYRIRKSWEDVKSQIGAYYNLDNAKTIADNNDGYNVYDENGELIYPERRNIMQLTYTKLLKNGSKGEEIRQLQVALNSLGYSVGTADGIWGSKTEMGVRNLQRDCKITIDGLVGKATIAKINELLNKNSVSQPNKPKKYKYGNANVIEVNPLDLYIEVVKMAGNKIKGDFINGSLFSHSKMISISTLVSNGKILAEHLPHDNVKRGTFVVYKNGDVGVEMIDFISKHPKLKDIKFAIGGFNIMPQGKTVRQQLKDEWFDYNAVGYRTWRTLLGFDKSKNKVLIVIAPNTDAEQGQKLLKDLGCDCAVGLDSGGSTCGRFNGSSIKSTSRVIHNIIRWN